METNQKMTINQDIYDLLRQLPDTERLQALDAIMAYSFTDTDDAPEGLAGFVYTAAKACIKNARTSRENGKRGGRPRKMETPTRSDEKGQKKQMKAPSLQQVETYAEDKGLNVDAEEFWTYYTARGWTSGGEPIYNWKAMLRAWSQRQHKAPAPQTMNTTKTETVTTTDTSATDDQNERERLLRALGA